MKALSGYQNGEFKSAVCDGCPGSPVLVARSLARTPATQARNPTVLHVNKRVEMEGTPVRSQDPLIVSNSGRAFRSR